MFFHDFFDFFGHFFIKTSPKPFRFHWADADFCFDLVTSRGRSSAANGPFRMSRHSNPMYSFQFVHFWGDCPVGTPPSPPNHPVNPGRCGGFPENPGPATCTTPLLVLILQHPPDQRPQRFRRRIQTPRSPGRCVQAFPKIANDFFPGSARENSKSS